jgi:two-component system chemotaxis sensor kinase CheA
MTDEFDNSESFADDMAEYLPTFLDETEEQLDDLIETLLTLEGDSDNHDALNEAFRLIHSIKGSAGIMGFENITVLTHHLENRFEQFRSGSAHLDESTMNLVLRCIDFLRTCNERLRTGQPLRSANELLAELNRLEEQPEEQPPAPEAKTTEPMTTEQSAADAPSAPSSLPSIPAALVGDESLIRMVIKFRDGLQLVDLKTQLIVSRLSSLGDVTFTIPEIDKLSEFEKLEQFEVYIRSDEDHSSLQSAAEVDGVESIEIDGHSSGAAKPIGHEDLVDIEMVDNETDEIEIEFNEPESATQSETPSFLPDQPAADKMSGEYSAQAKTNG